MKSISKNSGFSFYELMVVIAIMAVVAAFVIPNMIDERADAKLRGAVNNLKGDLNMAKMRAVKDNVPAAVQFYENRYEIFLDNDSDWILDSGERRIRNRVLPAGVSINLGAPDFFTDERTRFNNRGTAGNPGSVMLVNSNGDQRTLELNRLGHIAIH
jgi:type IV fimbrial biogenesis protein FimT